jgi:hypothetical protein
MPRPPRTDASSGLVTEASWQATVVDLAELRDWYVYHNPDSRRSNAGFPDLVLIRPPRVMFLELKRETGRLSPMQREIVGALENCPGVEVHVARPSDWEQVSLWLW